MYLETMETDRATSPCHVSSISRRFQNLTVCESEKAMAETLIVKVEGLIEVTGGLTLSAEVFSVTALALEVESLANAGQPSSAI